MSEEIKKVQTGWVLIEPIGHKRDLDIELPDSVKEESPVKGKVLKLDRYADGDNDMDLKVGDYIVYQQWVGKEYKTEDGKKLFFMKFEDVLAIINYKEKK